MASLPNVLPIFDEPDGNISLVAIADAIRKAKYEERLTCAELAFQLRCDPSTIKNAENRANLLRFDIVARLLRKYPQHCASIFQLWDPTPAEAPTISERLERIDRETSAIRKELT